MQPLERSESEMTFEAVYCEKNRISPSRFERRMLSDGVIIFFRPIVKMVMLVFPSVFRGELDHLSSLRQVRSRREFVSEMGSIIDFNSYQLPLWRSMLGLRMSTRRLSRLRKLLPKTDQKTQSSRD